jgi:hypothetical protein
LNLYGYVSNNPINANDPTGKALNFVLGGGGAVIGAIGGGLTAYVKSGGDLNKMIQGARTGAIIGGVSGLTFGAGTTTTVAALAARGAATGMAASAGGNAAGQFYGNEGKVNLTEVGVSGALGAFPGAAQGALKAVALSSGLPQNTANTLTSLGLVSKFKFATDVAGIGISTTLPSSEKDWSNLYKYLEAQSTTTLDGMKEAFGASFGQLSSNRPKTASGN